MRNREHPHEPAPFVDRAELQAAIESDVRAAAQSASASAAPLPAVVLGNVAYNVYTVGLLTVTPGGGSTPIAGAQAAAVNLAEPDDAPGQLEAGRPVLVWPSQGLYLMCESSGGGQPVSPSYWAKVVSGGGPDYVVRQQTPSGEASFADAAGAVEVVARNVWELSVDPDATADVPANAIVRVWEEPDTAGQTRRLFFYPIHAVYR